MTEIDERLRELGERLRGWAPNGDELADSTHRSIMRRRHATALLGGAAVASLTVVAMLGIANLTEGEAKVSPAGAPATADGGGAATPSGPDPSPSPEKVARDEFYGSVWPEDSRQETSAGCSAADPDPFRADALATALEFARVVLGWDRAEGAVGSEHRNSVQIELRRAGTGVAGVSVSMVEYAPDCWSVQAMDAIQLAGAPMPVVWNREVEAEGSDPTVVISVGFDAPDGAGGRVELEYGPHSASRRFTAGDVSITRPLVFPLGPTDPHDAGHALILFEDERGTVLTAVGVPLLPQKGIARSDGLP